jgi:hypothetical protein
MVATPPSPASCFKNCRRLFLIGLESYHRFHGRVFIVWLFLKKLQAISKLFYIFFIYIAH